MVVNILKYESDNLIILYYYVYSRLLSTTKIVVWNSIEFNKKYRVWFLDWWVIRVWFTPEENEKSADIGYYIANYYYIYFLYPFY